MSNNNSDRSELLERVGRLNQLVRHVQDVLFWWNCPDSEHCKGNSEWKNAIWSDTETIVQRSIELSDYNSQKLLKLRASCFSILNCLFAGHPGMVTMVEVDEVTRIVLGISEAARLLENENSPGGVFSPPPRKPNEDQEKETGFSEIVRRLQNRNQGPKATAADKAESEIKDLIQRGIVTEAGINTETGKRIRQRELQTLLGKSAKTFNKAPTWTRWQEARKRVRNQDAK